MKPDDKETSIKKETYILGACRLQVGSTAEELFKQRKDSIALQTRLQACQKLQVQLHVSPLPLGDLALSFFSDGGEDGVHNLRLDGVCHEHNSRHERRLQRLLDNQLHGQTDKGIT